MNKRKFIINDGKKYERISYADKLHGGTTVNFIIPVSRAKKIRKFTAMHGKSSHAVMI